MTIGWICLACALIILAIMALKPWLSKERAGTLENEMFGKNQGFSLRLDEFDARLQRRDEVMSFLNAGQKIKAIKIYREDTGASLADAKAAVERMELAANLGLAPGQTRLSEALNNVSDSLNGGIERLLIQGKKIQAIKLYREQTGLGLREAKDAVDLIENTLLVRGPSSFQAQAGDPNTEDGLPVLAAFDEEIRQHVLKGNKIQAIKLYRQQTGLGLREAKEAIDRLEQTVRYGLEQA